MTADPLTIAWPDEKTCYLVDRGRSYQTPVGICPRVTTVLKVLGLSRSEPMPCAPNATTTCGRRNGRREMTLIRNPGGKLAAVLRPGTLRSTNRLTPSNI